MRSPSPDTLACFHEGNQCDGFFWAEANLWCLCDFVPRNESTLCSLTGLFLKSMWENSGSRYHIIKTCRCSKDLGRKRKLETFRVRHFYAFCWDCLLWVTNPQYPFWGVWAACVGQPHKYPTGGKHQFISVLGGGGQFVLQRLR